ncbi:MAG: YdjY domain-containing protein [Phycisphaerales bacterium]|nr:YdjY domain-containing protein [Phycisphaerales bacterium]
MIVATLALAAAFAASEPPLPAIARSLPSAPPLAVRFADAPADPPPAAPAKDEWVGVFPSVRINRALKTVEFDGTVAWDFHNADTPRTELELLVCLPMRDKEHESLVLSKAKGTHVHAALLMVGLEPGTPGRLDFSGDGGNQVKRIAPTGPAVSVRFCYQKNGIEATDPAMSWVTDERPERPAPSLVFGGSSIGQMRNPQGDRVTTYNADELGTLIGLCTFGSETIGLTSVVSPDSGLDAPRFIGNNTAIPPADTAVRVRITAEPTTLPAPAAPQQPATRVQ